MSYPNGCYSHTQNLRLRPLKEMKSCVVFRPDPPKLFMLNLNAWFILELCDGSSAEQIEQNTLNRLRQRTRRRRHEITSELDFNDCRNRD